MIKGPNTLACEIADLLHLDTDLQRQGIVVTYPALGASTTLTVTTESGTYTVVVTDDQEPQ